jgi:hypothetical protein
LRPVTNQIYEMEDDSTIKRVGIAKLNSSNYRTWSALTKAVIEAKDVWDVIELYGPEAETSVKTTDDRTAEKKVDTGDRVKDAKARTVIMAYYGPEALSRVLHLRTAKE